jgi:hypothetical protein
LKLTAAMCEKKGMNDRNNRKKVGYSAGWTKGEAESKVQVPLLSSISLLISLTKINKTMK